MLVPHRPNMRVASELRRKSKKRKTNSTEANQSRRILCHFNRANPNPYTDTRRVSAILRHPRSAKPQLQRNKRHKRPIDVRRPSAILRHPRLSYDLHGTTSAARLFAILRHPRPAKARNYNETNGVCALPTPHDHPRFCVTHFQRRRRPRVSWIFASPPSRETATTTKQTAQAHTCVLRASSILRHRRLSCDLQPTTFLYNGYRT
jgi:hypothetical protein